MDKPVVAVTSMLRHGCTLVTRSEGEYLRTGVPLLNPWNARP
ncbi:MAG: hypothetical protein AB7T74_08715 [Clostridia bacterium]|jgi:hypothetical protein|nr:hypothetical protein [Spirochaetia bacterium]